jgi:hypothetical protein
MGALAKIRTENIKVIERMYNYQYSYLLHLEILFYFSFNRVLSFYLISFQPSFL